MTETYQWFFKKSAIRALALLAQALGVIKQMSLEDIAELSGIPLHDLKDSSRSDIISDMGLVNLAALPGSMKVGAIYYGRHTLTGQQITLVYEAWEDEVDLVETEVGNLKYEWNTDDGEEAINVYATIASTGTIFNLRWNDGERRWEFKSESPQQASGSSQRFNIKGGVSAGNVNIGGKQTFTKFDF